MACSHKQPIFIGLLQKGVKKLLLLAASKNLNLKPNLAKGKEAASGKSLKTHTSDYRDIEMLNVALNLW